MLNYGNILPEFQPVTALSGNTENHFYQLSRDKFFGSWTCLFFWPKAFTFVCPTEVLGFSELYDEFDKRKCKIYGVSVDSDYTQLAWKKSTNELKDVKIHFISDVRRELSYRFGVLNEIEGISNRATFLLDTSGNIRYSEMTDIKVGRNPSETLRILDALQTDKLCGCARKKGGLTLN